MNMNWTINTGNEESLSFEHADKEQFQVEDFYRELKEIPVDRVIGVNAGCCTTNCVSGDCSAEIKQENLVVVKQEPNDVCSIIYVILKFIGTETILDWWLNIRLFVTTLCPKKGSIKLFMITLSKLNQLLQFLDHIKYSAADDV